MKSLPVLTIVTVVYNGVKHLESTICNVLDLASVNLEYIIVDGGSTDGTLDIIKKYQKKVSYWVSEPDSGVYDAMNKGWRLAKDYSFILFLGAGDRVISLPDLRKFKTTDVIFGDVLMGRERFTGEVSMLSRIGNTLHHQAMLVNKSIHPAPPFDVNFRMYADLDFNQRLIKKGYNFVRDDDFLAYALPGGISSRPSIWERTKIVSKNYGFFYSCISFSVFYVGTARKFLSNYFRTIITQ